METIIKLTDIAKEETIEGTFVLHKESNPSLNKYKNLLKNYSPF